LYSEGECAVLIENVPAAYPRSNLERVLKSVQGCELESVEFLEVNPQNGYSRDAKATFKTPEQAKLAIEYLDGTSDDEFVFRLAPYLEELKYKVSPWIEGSFEEDLTTAIKLIKLLDKEKNITDFLEELSQVENLQNRLDLHLFYLRYVHLYCYYCAVEFTTETELRSKCGILHVRAATPSQSNTDKGIYSLFRCFSFSYCY
jgi:hypothetical protein